MKTDSAWNMFVFRDGRRTVPGSTLARSVADALAALYDCPEPSKPDTLTNALLLAGEMECALTDAGSPESSKAARITESLARSLICSERDGAEDADASTVSIPELMQCLPAHPPAELKISPPEGFAYYALHPLDFADLATGLSLDSRAAGVIGIRSIGVTLSALVLAAVRRRGLNAERFSVRPLGHPYERKTEFSGEQAARIRALRARGAEFLIVDEGPGMSGSSFLSVGDALSAMGVSTDRITFLGSRIPDPNALRAKDAARRWRAFRACFARQNSRVPNEAKLYVGGGDWRRHVFDDPVNWPASWTQMERLKFLSPDRRQLFKFEGFSRFGQAVHDRARQVATAGFGPMPREFTQGFSVYPMLKGRSLSPADLTPTIVDRMADYCAFRAHEFRTNEHQNTADLETMVRFNVAEEFGYELPLQAGSLFTESPIHADGRMLPHEWIELPTGEYQKADAASHGDDHFFPGPTDIAWDLAGAMVEWNMPPSAQERFVSRYKTVSGDDPSKRIASFVLAYTVFRCGYCLMAAEAVRGSGDEHRLLMAHDRYRAALESRLPQSAAA